jgi:hypothetical protein
MTTAATQDRVRCVCGHGERNHTTRGVCLSRGCECVNYTPQ